VHQGRGRWGALANIIIKILGSLKCRKFLNQLRTCQLLKKDYVPWT